MERGDGGGERGDVRERDAEGSTEQRDDLGWRSRECHDARNRRLDVANHVLAHQTAALVRGGHDAEGGEHNRNNDQDLAVVRDREARRVALARPRKEDEKQSDMHDRPGDNIQAHARNRLRGLDPSLLHEAHAECHAPDVGGCDAVDERGRELRFQVRDERQVFRHASCHTDRRGDVGQDRHRDASDEPYPVGVAQSSEAVADVGQLWEQNVERAREGHDREDGPGPNPHEALEGSGLLAGGLGDPGTEIAKQRFRCLLPRGG